MARYYCVYCNSYLTHDTSSVRRSHLVGKHHVKAVADYYRNRSAVGRQAHSVALTLAKRRYKKLLAKAPGAPEGPLGLLAAAYAAAPGHSLVFDARQRKDIAQYVRASRLPQRSNVAAATVASQQASTSKAAVLPSPAQLPLHQQPAAPAYYHRST
ncbi:hypothetical protein TPHA_0K01040 [Tetrapisispora phaffii CBS 4417]|uniref:Matrin-type domain-containing protein n=1 Tax=Tetrapisispora phaffii (strain ATCC 24235 / CBS 4417 / NBRC 1672 / NRRL Y-8282 / UCD 70-5) TaxID=1071381 RepID=G8BZB0_TETPH|nr:hypothetical protein TPHA_0K01040 [Tetrapisispora phaffii CBS 4417]CCE65238.1 hypothetical protein TPHA_0K01040 [Tetrapisispora phaffii CBS 4417]